jgi:hypothetical protein
MITVEMWLFLTGTNGFTNNGPLISLMNGTTNVIAVKHANLDDFTVTMSGITPVQFVNFNSTLVLSNWCSIGFSIGWTGEAGNI